MLQATRVIQALEEYAKAVPEVPLRYSEYSEDERYGIIVIVPQNFDMVPPLVRAVAYAEIEKLMIKLMYMETNPIIKIGTHFV